MRPGIAGDFACALEFGTNPNMWKPVGERLQVVVSRISVGPPLHINEQH